MKIITVVAANSSTKIVVNDDFNRDGVKVKLCLPLKAVETFVKLMQNHEQYRQLFVRNHAHVATINLVVKEPLVAPIDYCSCHMVSKLLWEQVEMEDALHWLSTLGGAYSNLGEHSLSFAVRAGDNAFRQMRIALKSSDPSVIFRCWLFVAMSLMQLGDLQQSKRILQNVHSAVGKKILPDDKTVLTMCLGIWARLQYAWARKKH